MAIDRSTEHTYKQSMNTKVTVTIYLLYK